MGRLRNFAPSNSFPDGGRRRRLLSCTALASGLMAGMLALPALAGDGLGSNGTNGTPPAAGGTFDVPGISVDNPAGISVTVTSGAVLPGPNGGNGGAGTGGPGNPGATGPNGSAGADGDPGDNGGSANGTGGLGGNGASSTGRSISPVLIGITGGNIANGAKVDVAGDDAQGGKGGNGGAGTGGDNTTGKGGDGGHGSNYNPAGDNGQGGHGGLGGLGGDAKGTGRDGGAAAFGTGGGIGAITVKADGTISGGVEISAKGGKGTGGAGGSGGAGTGGIAGAGGAGGIGGGTTGVGAGSGNSAGNGGAGNTGGDATGTGGNGAKGEAGTGGSVADITVAAGGSISGDIVIDAFAGMGEGGNGGAGGNGTGGTGGTGGDGGKGGSILGPIDSSGSNNKAGTGGAGGTGGLAGGTGGNGSEAGKGTGGDTGKILITPGGDLIGGMDIESRAGSAKGGTGGAGGNGIGGTPGVGGKGGAGGDIATVANGFNNIAGVGGKGGAGNAAVATGGNAGKGGDAKGGTSGAITITLPGSASDDIVIVTAGGAATGGDGGKGGDGGQDSASAAKASAGGAAGTGGTVQNVAGGSTGNNGGLGGEGGAPGQAADATGGTAGNGGTAKGGDAGAVDVTLNGATAQAVKITAEGGDAAGGAGGAGGNARGTNAPTGIAGGQGGNTVFGTGGSYGGGGKAGDGGSSANATGGTGGQGGDATGGNAKVSVTTKSVITTAGPAIDINATGGDAKGGAGGIGGDGLTGRGGTGGAGGGSNTVGGAAGNGGNGGNGTGGDGGAGGTATAGSAAVAVKNSGDITTTGGSAIHIIASGGAATGGDGRNGGQATAGAGSQGGKGGAGGELPGEMGGKGGDGGSAGTAFQSDGGAAGAATGGSATVDVTNDGRIRASDHGIDITATAGSGIAGEGGLRGNTGVTSTGASGGQGGSGYTPGQKGKDGTGGGVEEGDNGAPAAGVNGTASITVKNSSLIDADKYGIRAETHGQGVSQIHIDNSGDIASSAGLFLKTESLIGGSAIDVVNKGSIANKDVLAAAAINADGAATSIHNSGTVVGYVDLTDEADFFENKAGGTFEARGASLFGGKTDSFTNQGTLRAAAPETVSFNDLEIFDNGGLVTMVDGAATGKLVMTAGGAGTAYKGDGGTLAVDAVLGGPGTGKADLLEIHGSSTGNTKVAVHVIDVAGANDEGIPVVTVTGTSDASHFTLAGPLNAGFFTWDLRYDAGAKQHELYSAGLGIGGAEFPAGITAAQDLWHQTTGTLLERQADLRPLLGGTQVTPVADYSEPVAPTPVARVTPGFWLKGVGAYLERDDEHDGFTLDRKQTIWGGVAGFDFGTQSAGEAWLFGVFAGYVTSDLDFDKTNTKWTYDGPTVGLYATYLDHEFHVDATLKADFLDVDIDAREFGATSGKGDTDVFNIGGRIDTGYKIDIAGGMFLEPQASFAVVRTEIDDTDIFGGTVEFDDETSVRGRLGLRLGHEFTSASQMVYSSDVTASVWQEFNGENDASLATPGMASFDVSDDPAKTVGDVSLGFSVAAPDGWSAFLRGNYQFSDDFAAVAGNAGLRYAW